MTADEHRALLRTLFTPPFRRWTSGSYVCDLHSHMVACPDDDRGSPYIPRGWGRIQYLKNGGALMDQWEVVFAEVVGEDSDQDSVIAKLNAAAADGGGS